MIGTVTVSVDAPAGNVTDSSKGAKIGLGVAEGPKPVDSSDALKSTISGSPSASAGHLPEGARIRFCRYRVTTKAPIASSHVHSMCGQAVAFALLGAVGTETPFVPDTSLTFAMPFLLDDVA